MVQYIGNDEILKAHAHGNAKNTARLFVRTETKFPRGMVKTNKIGGPKCRI